MLPKYEAQKLSNKLFELFLVTCVSEMPVIFILHVFSHLLGYYLCLYTC